MLIAPALKTGKLTLVTNAMAREVTVGKDGLADGVTYIDKTTGTERHVRARVIVLAASACESARILLNSRSSLFPQGLANSSGVVGKYLTDTTGTGVSGFIPKMVDHVPHNEDGVGGAHIYMPWWLDNAKLDFPRGYHIEMGGGLDSPGYGFMGGIQELSAGRRLRQAAQGRLSPLLRRVGRILRPRRDDPQRRLLLRARSRRRGPVGHSGAPLPLEVERPRAEPGEAHAGDLPRAHRRDGRHGVRPMPTREQGYGIAHGGQIIHELGCVIMGSDPDKSALNANCQAHDCKNLFVADGGPFVSQADKNPTWTILALSMRTSEYIAQQRNGGCAMSRHLAPHDGEVARGRAGDRRDRRGARRKRRAPPSICERSRSRARRRTRRNSSRRNEWATVRVLVDYMIPRDERSGSATDARVPEFMDFILADSNTNDETRTAMRGGLAWLDLACEDRFGKTFAACTDAQRRQLLDDIAWPKKAKPEYSQGAAFFSRSAT